MHSRHFEPVISPGENQNLRVLIDGRAAALHVRVIWSVNSAVSGGAWPSFPAVLSDTHAAAAFTPAADEAMRADATIVPTRPLPQTLGEMILDAAVRYEGAALQYRRDGQTVRISYPALGAISTETPKGCMLSHENFIATVRMYEQRLGPDRTHRELTPTMKVKRAMVYYKYSDVFIELYESGRAPGHEHERS